MDNDLVIMKPKKKKNHNKSLNSIQINPNNGVHYRTHEKDNDHNINDSDSTEKKMSELNTLATKKPKKNKKHNKSLDMNSDINEAEFTSFERTSVEVGEQNINDSDSRENVKKLSSKKKYIKSLNLIESNLINDAEINKSLEGTCKEVNGQNIIDSYSRKNVNRKRKSEMNGLVDISLSDNCSIDNEYVPTKKTKKEKNHNGSLNSIKLNTNHSKEIQAFERPFVNDSNNSNVVQIIKSELNVSSNISLKNKCSMDKNNAVTKKSKKEKKDDKSLNSIELNTNIDAYFKNEKNNELNINGSDSKENNIIPKIIFEVNALADMGNDCINGSENIPTKKKKKKKNHNKSINMIELDTINDADCYTYEKNNEQKINDLPTKKPKKKKNHDKSLNSIALDPNHDKEIQMLQETHEEVNGSDYRENVNQRIKSKLNTSTDILLENKCSIDIDNVAIKKRNKKKKHNKSLSSIKFNTNNDTYFRPYEKKNELNINCFDSKEDKVQKKMSEMNALADISLGNNCNNDTENILAENHNTNLNININHNTEFKTFEKIYKEDSEPTEPSMNDSDTNELSSAPLEISYGLDTENIATKESKKRKKHNILKTVISDCTDENKMLSQPNLTFPTISQNQCELKTLLNSIEKYNVEESSTIDKTNFNLKQFNLIKYLTNKDPSLKNHPNFKQINEYLSKKIKLTINTKCEVGASDILLLKTVGNIILKKIVEKIDSAQDIKDLVIELPAECQENKIHFMETTLSRLPNKLKMDIIKKHNPLIKLRVFNEDEDRMIREYWSKFQKEYNISNILPFLSNGVEMALSPNERLQFIRYISAGLPNRLLYSVFNRFNILFNEYQDKTSFSEEEDQLIIKVDKCDAIRNKFSVLSLILNRTRLQLYRRIEVLRNQHKEFKKVIWDDQKRQELFTNILLETNTEHWKHLKSLTITKDIWITIAKNLGDDFTYKKVRYQWNYLYTMLFCEKPILMSTFNLTTLKLLKQINAKHWSDLDWIEITNKLYPGANSKVICTFFHSWIDRKVPSKIKGNIQDTLNYLQCHEVDKLKKRIDKHGEREFPRLTVKHFDLLVNNQ
ncbi:protein PFF0380w-like [Myzus persicae]|uniref:protein PFF0380w-like n=1 Tax=Myzus persicae TaxID=13164 RepID=UPI000B930672|nr:protein PFF0380w-like [Myzus persicae]